MNLSQLVPDLAEAEALLASGEAEAAVGALSRLAEDAEEYVARNCETTETVQWFSFEHLYERLCYKRVEKDPRELRDVGEPLDRLYADLAFALIHTGDYDQAMAAMAQAIRWNPMQCSYRLDLGELHRIQGDISSYLGFSFSVFERASDARHLVRAYCAFGRYFMETGKPESAEACLAAAQRFGLDEPILAKLLEEAHAAGIDPAGLGAETVNATLEAEGLPEGANAEVAVTLLMCAVDAAEAGDNRSAQELTLKANGLVGTKACQALLALIRDADREMKEGGRG
jgi:tetratricopeptide (TPR) repeat protein